MDSDGKEIPGNPTEDGENPKKDIPGYEFVETKKDENGNTKHIYKKIPAPTPTPSPSPTPAPTPEQGKKNTTYVDSKGKTLIPQKDGEQPSENIPGYELERTEKDEKGNTRHIYRKVETLTPEQKPTPAPTPAPAKVEEKETPASKQPVVRQELPNTGTGNEMAIFGAAASAILAGIGMVGTQKTKKEDEEA